MGLWGWLTGRGRDEPEPEPPAPPAPTEADVLAALDRLGERARSEGLAVAVLTRIARIDRAIRTTLPRLRTFGLGSYEGYAVVATALSYLPEALEAYLRLPRDWADQRPVDRGRTSLMLLVDQLDLLAASTEQILDAAARADAQALIQHGRFLAAKFGGGSGDVHATAAPPPAPRTPGPANPLDLP
ncbi:hypothetical protein [Auraticoccus monumenti]|uniref:Uncharacterized protein n=1 Tax=Auraticoccus monumenti TaxID=675864 RepID=A0A1G7AJ68_9ACTN|nr:hypothetical protein [Auraticoccus monumenti]SDE14760.1 hypothetical protein SAMN04489747_2634 [Auraticoccus monumenti]